MKNPEIAKQLLLAWTSGDWQTTRDTLADDVEFVGPLGTTRGADAYIKGIREFAAMIERVDIQRAFGDGDDVCVIYDLVAKSGAKCPPAGHYRVVDGKVALVRAYFDPAPLKYSQPTEPKPAQAQARH